MQIIIWNTRYFDWNHFEHNSCNFSWVVIPGSKYHWAVVIVGKSSNAFEWSDYSHDFWFIFIGWLCFMLLICHGLSKGSDRVKIASGDDFQFRLSYDQLKISILGHITSKKLTKTKNTVNESKNIVDNLKNINITSNITKIQKCLKNFFWFHDITCKQLQSLKICNKHGNKCKTYA